jgi:hypothetical protein
VIFQILTHHHCQQLTPSINLVFHGFSSRQRVAEVGGTMEGRQQKRLQTAEFLHCEAWRRFPLLSSFHQVLVILAPNG